MNDVLKVCLRAGSTLQRVEGSGNSRIRSLRDRNSRVVLHDACELQNVIWQDKAVSIKGQQVFCTRDNEIRNVRCAFMQLWKSGCHDNSKTLTYETYVTVEIHRLV